MRRMGEQSLSKGRLPLPLAHEERHGSQGKEGPSWMLSLALTDSQALPSHPSGADARWPSEGHKCSTQVQTRHPAHMEAHLLQQAT